MFIFLLVFFIILKIYFPWFEVGKNLSNGDWPYLFLENIREFSFLPHQPVLWLTPYYQITAKIFTQYLGFPWELTEKIVWFWTFVLLSIFSSYYLTRSWIGVLIYLTNTYILMLVSGGQMGVALAYSIAPFVLGRFMNLVSTVNKKPIVPLFHCSIVKKTIITGLILALQVMWDPRVAYITLIAVGGYSIFKLKVTVKNLKLFLLSLFFVFGIPLLITVTFHMFWILPLIITGFSGMESFAEVYTTAGAVKFFSFASFSNTISLLHPNWPENIFGKTYFMRWEFLIIPIPAFSSLLFLKKPRMVQWFNGSMVKNNNRAILFFAFVALLSAFLAKGANPPFGEVYLWLFTHYPGFLMFRDPTKFYLLVAISYSILIPYSLFGLGTWINEKFKMKNEKRQFKIKNFLILAFLPYWLFLIRPAWLGQLGGTFKIREVPGEYVKLKDFLSSQPEFFRTFWIPQRQRFGFYSNNHPAIDSVDLLKVGSASAVVSWLQGEEAEEQLSRWAVKYVIVPYDSEGEIFLEDRKYTEEERRRVEEDLQMVKWLKWLDGWGKIAVFEALEFKDHFWREENLKSQNF